jgi:hypothetical protein
MLMTLLAQSQGGLVAGMAGMMIVVWIIALLASVFWLWMLIDVLTSSMDSMEKILWFLVVFFLHLVGALIYFFVRRSGGGGRLATR